MGDSQSQCIIYTSSHQRATTCTSLLNWTVEIETCGLNGDDLSALAKKTFVLITTVGPYGQHGEHVSGLKQ